MRINSIQNTQNATAFQARIVKPVVSNMTDRRLYNQIIESICANGQEDEYLSKCQKLKEAPNKSDFYFTVSGCGDLGIRERFSDDRYTYASLENYVSVGSAALDLLDNMLKHRYVMGEPEPSIESKIKKLNKSLKKI